ncbi:unnamed protein product, partial [marine sediment metagenome]
TADIIQRDIVTPDLAKCSMGVWTTRYVRGVSVRCVLGILTII